MVLIYFLIAMLDVQAAQEFSASLLKDLKPLSADYSLPDITSKKEKVLYFWATWCTSCRQKLTKELSKSDIFKNADVYLISIDNDREKVAHFREKNEINLQIAWDENKTLQKQFGVNSVPRMLRLKPAGNMLSLVSDLRGEEVHF